ncbi:hypothetical protein CCH79_00017401 [Gambusia affinis]|uniref:Uncharacterized protein n=1 Tax=Gambusia affinis TaxID=33528 RepID=A0A315W7K7_GAMAF|nr:hypothetical protein CCH79_00017401 [Gambusia affinis]
MVRVFLLRRRRAAERQ